MIKATKSLFYQARKSSDMMSKDTASRRMKMGRYIALMMKGTSSFKMDKAILCLLTRMVTEFSEISMAELLFSTRITIKSSLIQKLEHIGSIIKKDWKLSLTLKATRNWSTKEEGSSKNFQILTKNMMRKATRFGLMKTAMRLSKTTKEKFTDMIK